MKETVLKTIRKVFNRSLFVRPFEFLTGTKSYAKIPQGVDPLTDINYYIPHFKFATIIDIGANVGQSAIKFSRIHPNAKIYSFEPVPETFNKLKANTNNNQNITCYNRAFGDKIESLNMQIHGSEQSVSNTLQTNTHNGESNSSIQVAVTTLDHFTSEHLIPHIDYLKIDTEGFDLKVLHGANQLIANQRIDFIEVEASMNITNTFHINQQLFIDYLNQFGYRLFGVYEQIHDFQLSQPILRRANLVFISPKVYE